MNQNDEQQRVLVTGAGGFTGAALTLALARRGTPVRAMVRPGSSYDHLRHDCVEVIEGDIRRRDDVMRAAEGVEIIYHIAAAFRVAGQPDSFFYDINAKAVEYIIEAARAHGIWRTVHCSTIGVHGDVQEIPCRETSPFNPGDIYQVTKLEGEKIAAEAFRQGVPGVIFRPASIYGPGDLRLLKLFRTVHQRQFRMIGSGETFFHTIYIDDLVQGILLCGEHPDALGETYILCCDEYVTLNELVKLVAQATGVKPPRGHIPLWPVQLAATFCETVCKPLRIEPPLHHRRVGFFTKNRAFTNEKAKRELGFQPQVNTAEGVKRTAEWYFQQNYLKR